MFVPRYFLKIIDNIVSYITLDYTNFLVICVQESKMYSHLHWRSKVNCLMHPAVLAYPMPGLPQTVLPVTWTHLQLALKVSYITNVSIWALSVTSQAHTSNAFILLLMLIGSYYGIHKRLATPFLIQFIYSHRQ